MSMGVKNSIESQNLKPMTGSFGGGFGKTISRLTLPGAIYARSENKAATAKGEAGPQQAGKKGTSVGNRLLISLLGPAGMLFR